MAEFYRGFTFERDVKGRLTIEGNLAFKRHCDDARSVHRQFPGAPGTRAGEGGTPADSQERQSRLEPMATRASRGPSDARCP